MAWRRTPFARSDARDSETNRKVRTMEKKKKKKAGSGTPIGPKQLFEYKSREADGKTSQTDTAFHNTSGKAKSIPRKG